MASWLLLVVVKLMGSREMVVADLERILHNRRTFYLLFDVFDEHGQSKECRYHCRIKRERCTLSYRGLLRREKTIHQIHFDTRRELIDYLLQIDQIKTIFYDRFFENNYGLTKMSPPEYFCQIE